MSEITFLQCKINLSRKSFEPELETEFWVGKVITKISAIKPVFILDMFSGSGCIGIAVLKSLTNSRVDFVDVSGEATKQIKINLKLNNIPEERYGIYQSDLFRKIPKNLYDFIFANPPYVALNRKKEVQKEVLKKNPRKALFAGPNGMALIKKFLARAVKYLKPKGKIFMEFDPLQKKEIKKIMLRLGLKTDFYEDQFQKCRWLEAGY